MSEATRLGALPLPGFSLSRPAWRRARTLIALLGAVANLVFAAPAGLKSVAEIRAVPEWNLRERHPLRLEAMLTWVDSERRIVVLQEGGVAIALRTQGFDPALLPGRRVAIEASDSWPLLARVPDFPSHPSGSELLSSFEAPSVNRRNYLARVRGYVHPPTSGVYRFWVASDDSSEVWLGTNEDPATARPIAAVSTWTKEREWTYLPGQESAGIYLEAGRRYYIEAVHEQASGEDHLSVSWEGPGVPHQIIASQHLSAWTTLPSPNGAGDASGRGRVLREYWWDRAVESAVSLTAPRSLEAVLDTAELSVRVLGPGDLPPPRALQPGEPLRTSESFVWAEIDGVVDFVARRGRTLVLDLSAGSRRTRAILQDWEGEPPPRLGGRRVRLQGVAEATLNEAGHPVLGTLWVPRATTIPVLDVSPRNASARPTTIAELLASDPHQLRNRLVKFIGRIGQPDKGRVSVNDAGSFYSYVSEDGVNWKLFAPPVEIPMGETVEIGLAVTSHSTETVAAVFDNVRGVPAPLKETAVGGPTRPGELRHEDGRLTLRGSGHDVWFSPDQFHFAHTSLTGPGEIVARIVGFDATAPWAKAGVMIRESLAPDAQFVDLVQTGAHGCCFQWRRAAEGSGPLSVADASLKAPHWVKLARRFNAISVAGEHITAFPLNARVEIIGYLAHENGELVIVDASCRELPDDAKKPVTQTRPLVELADALGPAGDPDRPEMFKARAVVTFHGEVAGRRYFAVQDRSGATFVVGNTRPRVPKLRAGQFVEIHRNAGAPPSPPVSAANVFVLGEGVFPTPLPHPLEYSLPRRGEGTWVEVEGIVRSIAANGIGKVKTKGELVSFFVSGAAGKTLPRHIDGRVRMRGAIAFPTEAEPLLLVPSLEHFELTEPPPKEPFALPPQAIDQFTFANPLSESPHRVKTRGTVTFTGRGFLYVQDATGGARVELSEPSSVQLGEVVDAVGFPDLTEDRSLVLTNALVRTTGATREASPTDATADEFLAGNLRGRLVRVEAVVSRLRTSENDATLDLQLGQRLLRAALTGGASQLPSIPPGSVVALTGICVPATALPDSMPAATGAAVALPARLLLRGPSDLVMLQKPRWWVVKRTLLVISVIGAVLIVSAIWIHVLRRRVAQRTAELRATMEKLQRETQTAATLAERNRLAGEIHDSLEQGFSGLILQLDTTAKKTVCPPEVRAGLALARNMVAFSRNEVRHAVWDLQSPVLENSDLGTALKQIVEQLAPETPHTTVTVVNEPRRLSSAVDHHLLRIAQEAITNCVKHAEARTLEVVLSYGEDEVVLSIRDDGRGFEPGQVLSGGVGHFGLRSLRGRASKIHGSLRIDSAPGNGTTVEVRVAVPAEATV